MNNSNIENIIDNYLNADANELLIEAKNEIIRLKNELSEQHNLNNYKFGHELKALLRISRRSGFRFVYASDQEKKDEYALDLVQELSKSVNLPYHKEVVNDLILNVKDHEEVELLK